MANAIVVDCGGSTRIKRIMGAGGDGDMRGLLDVQDLPGVGRGSQAHVPAGAGGPFSSMTIMFQDAEYTPFTIPGLPLPRSFQITSHLGQNVRGDLDPGGTGITITIFGNDVDPLVEARQLRTDPPAPAGNPGPRRRRYIVANAGPIKTISLDGVTAYDATNAEGPPLARPTAPGAVGPAGGPGAPAAGLPLYVSVVVT